MPTSRSSNLNLSSLLHPSLSLKTGLQTGDLSPEQSAIVNKKLNERLQAEVARIHGALTTVLPAKRDVLKQVFNKIGALDFKTLTDKKVGEVIAGALTDEDRKNFSEEELRLLNNVITTTDTSSNVRSLLYLDVPLNRNPLLSDEILTARTLEIGKISGIKPEAMARITEKNIPIDSIDESSLDELVKDNLITTAQKDELISVSRLALVSGGNADLITALREKKVQSPIDMVAWEKDDLVKLITEKKIAIPAGEDNADTYAQNILETVESSFPTEFFLTKTISKFPGTAVTKLATTVEPLLQKNIPLFEGEYNSAVNFTEQDLQDIPAATRKEVIAGVEALRPVVNTYRYLGIGQVLSGKGTVDEKKAEVSKRVGALNTFYQNNPDIDITSTRFDVDLAVKENTSLNWKDIDSETRPLVQKQMAAFQRSYIMGTNQKNAERLMTNGFDSALRITSLTEEDFIAQSGLDITEGRKAYKKAGDLALGAAHYYTAIRDSVKNVFNTTNVSNQHPLVNDLKEIDGFDQLFGNQDFCDCSHCRSVLGPAAYFCDLMYFVQENVSKKVFTGSNATHPLYLKRRRPDLWKLTLTCDHTSTEIPYLQVVNEVLQTYLQTELGVADVYEHLRTADRSVRQPFNLSLEELRLYLSHFGLSLYDVYKELQVAIKDQHRERLKLSPAQLNIITTKDTAGVKKRFGNKALANFNVQEFIGYAGITRTELDELLATTFIPDISQVKVKTIKDPSDIQKYSEQLQNLTEARLDYIHRYLRMWKKTSWTLREFDLLLNSLKAKGWLNNLEEETSGYNKILQLAQLMNFQERLGAGVEELATIAHKLPETSIADNQEPFASRIFDLDKINDAAVINKTPYILAGIGITEAELLALTPQLGIDLAQPITIPVLSNLYRHARIARGLKWTIEDFIFAMGLVLNGQPVQNFDDIQKLADFADWLQKTPLKIADIVFILAGTENSTNQYRNTADTLAAKVLEIQNQEAVVKETDAAAKLTMKRNLLRDHILSSFNITADQLDNQFLTLVATSFTTASATALNTTFTNEVPDQPADLTDLLNLLHALERYNLLFTKHEFTPDNITFIISNSAAFGIADLKSLTLTDLKNISLYRELVLLNTEAVEKLEEALTAFQTSTNFTGHEQSLADVWKQPLSLITSILNNVTLAVPALDAAREFWSALRLCEKLGIQGDSLNKLVANDYKTASGVALGAFSSKYPEEATRKQKLEPYTDKLHTLKRDALCDYIISREDKFKFSDLTDLYAFFLLDVEMSGCFRTSYIVAAITSLQLYVMRCLTNLEASDNNLNPSIPNIKVQPTWIPADEWDWRKNYRVWEANRKVFLFAENYIDPTLRDTKTHIFKELEDELLQQKITKESAEMAYKKYMAQFAELTRLRYAGAYYNSAYDNYGFASLGNGATNNYFFVNTIYFPAESDESCYYLFARTNVMPYQYFYRTYNHYKETWGNWTKIELGIEAKEISSLIHQGRLYIFWTEAKNKEMNSVSGGDSTSSGFIFTGYVKYSFLTENGKWSAPQRLTIGQDHSSKQKIYGRGRNTTAFNDDRWEKEKDAIVEAFQEKVFRKPYAHKRSSDTATPIGLGYIWSVNKGVSNVQYTSNAVSYSANLSAFKVSFNIPSRSFTVVNNDFSNARADVNISVKIEMFGATITQTVPGTITMSPGVCLFATSVAGLSIVISVGYSSSSSPGAIKESTFKVSLSRNLVTNPADQNLFNGGGSLNSYQDEYNVAYTENGDLVHYIENGSKYMSQHKLSQTKEGLGGLHIYNHNKYHFVSANTILTNELADILYAKGVEEFLSLKTQEMTDATGNQFDFRGPYGEYYWEIFFHIPFLIANHFNANQKFEDAKWWYERIFNPTAEETPSSTKPTDHNWQFREFRGLTPQKLKDILTDVKAIEVYKKDPFDPHAIARLRISAYQKAIVMKYIDNLLDWGDYLFTQDTRESINEAEMLYRLALNILGKRPVKMGKCETANENLLTYEKIGPQIGNGSEFLITLENVYVIQKNDYQVGVGIVKNSKSLAAAFGMEMKQIDFNKLTEQASIKRLTDIAGKLPVPSTPVTGPVVSNKLTQKALVAKSYADRVNARAAVKEDTRKWERTEKTREPKRSIGELKFKKQKRFPSFDVVKQCSTAFCVPENSDLIKYWDRVDDRLFKIWNCMNIKGIRRSLSLFQPPIDPMMLVRLRAAGLSLEDILAIILNSAQIPNYRFSFLVEKAKQYAQTVQSFGSSLLAALEKKDVEELLLLRTTHEKNILRLTKEIKKNQVKEAKNQYQAAVEGLTNVQNRIDYYQGLVDTGLIPWEIAEQAAKWTAGSIRITEATFGFLASVFGFLPQIGSPFAMKYGGQELKNGTKSLQDATGTLAAIADNIAILAGLEAGHQRREQEWKQQLKLFQQEYKQANQMMLAAEVRQLIAEQDLAMHEKTMEQLDELNDFYKNKFTNLGLYNYLASGLNRIYRASYNIAYDLAKLAERAYQFERYDNSFYIQSDNWQFDKAGLLAGERLLQQLMELEKKYIETNTRMPEITQSFSLALLDAGQLVQLRQTGSCTIKIPELAFEVFYPGQYRRVIKSVRVSIPCVAGPYTNISARLTLLKGEIEEAENDPLKEIDIAKNTSISTSSANNDAGLFELRFHDDRYLPFEGAGAISEWRLELPSMMRSFNYDTIPDVIMHLNYTALDGDRTTAENALSASFMNFATTNGLFRLFSLKYDFPDAYAKLFAQPLQQTEMNIDKMHFPYALSQKALMITSTKVYLKPKKESTVTVPASFKVNGNNSVTWGASDDIAFPGAAADKNKIKGGTVNLSGDPIKKWTLDAGNNGLNKDDLDDILILLNYRI
jgi:hypothetical protein